MKNNMLITAIIIVIVAVVAFFGGMKYQEGKQSTFSARFGDGQRTAGFGGQQQNGTRTGMGQNFRPVSGEILNIDDKNMTVKLSDGSSKIVILSSSSAYLKTSQASKSDLKTGDKITVIGTQNSDGSVTAQDIQIGSMLRGMTSSGSAR